MSKNKMQIKIGSRTYTVIDLSQPLHSGSEVFPGDPKPDLNKVFCEIAKTGFQYHIQTVGDHNFRPHGDAPSHQNPDLQHQGFEHWGLEHVFNSATMIDLSDVVDAETTDGIRWLTKVERKHLLPYAKQIIGKGAVVVRTGYDKWLEANNPHSIPRIPYLSPDAADFIAGFDNLKVFATDSLTVDPAGIHYTHQRFKKLFIVESLPHLHEIPQNAREKFDLQTSPIRIAGATGGPVAAYAFIEE